ncbi:MAG TPA: HAMP domain-containing sensor histidine kinase, partial [Acidobacteriota bacterium]|nr:HAMP domain-containing sensor histidine kinase [Acidobacteriota bacterium]
MINQAVKSLLEMQKEAVLIRDENGNVLFGNRASHILYGEKWESLSRRPAEWKRIVESSQKMQQEFTLHVKRKNTSGYSVEMNLKILPFWNEIQQFCGVIERVDSAPLPPDERKPSGMALAMSVAHDLRSPLAILQNLALLMDTRFEPRYVDLMRKQLVYCESIVNNFLEVSGERHPRKATISLESILGEVISEIPVPEQISVDITAFENVMVEGDPGQLRHLVMNLIQNAVESMHGIEGVVKISVSAKNEMMCLDVSDAGPGIEAEDLNRVFQPFYSTKIRGFGLGLAACKQIVDAHGGNIEIESTPGAGTTFRVFLP